MTCKFIPVEQSFAEWNKDPKYVAEYAALGQEFALATARIQVLADAETFSESDRKIK